MANCNKREEYKQKKEREKWCEHEPQTLTEKDITIFWDIPMQTDCEIKPADYTLQSRTDREKSCLFIDMTIPIEKNTSVKVTEKRSKYRDLDVEIERM